MKLCNTLHRTMGRFGIALSLLLVSMPGWAQWQLDAAQSTLNFISIKNNSVAETHSFTALEGEVDATGAVQLRIELDSVETLIPIRNERLRELLFETARYPVANISAQLDPALLSSAQEISSEEIVIQLSLHGSQKELTVPVLLARGEGGALRVVSERPIILNAQDFNLEAGVVALLEIAGLKAISSAVPVTFNLVFQPVQS